MRQTERPPRPPRRSVEGAAVSRRTHGERGDSLVEIAIASALMGIAFVAIVSGLSALSVGAARHNEAVLLESALSQAKQSVATQTFSPVPLATCGPTYVLPSVSGVTFQQCITLPASPLTLQQVTITATGPTTMRSAVIFKGPR